MNTDKIMGIFRLIFTTIFMIAMSFIEPVFLYVWGGAILIVAPAVCAFAFIDKIWESEDTE